MIKLQILENIPYIISNNYLDSFDTTKMVLFKDLLKLFYPNICIYCENELLVSEKILCTICRHNLPIIKPTSNKVAAVFYGRININRAISFLYYRKHTITQKLIQELKYKNNQNIGTFIGNWFGNELKLMGVFNNIDYIIPVPLHSKKEKLRGYNQLTTFGQALSKQLQITYKEGVLLRIGATKTQTLKNRFERFSNTETRFLLEDIQFFENKKILLIDDVITTGATIEACCNELLKTKNITINIATIAFTERY